VIIRARLIRDHSPQDIKLTVHPSGPQWTVEDVLESFRRAADWLGDEPGSPTAQIDTTTGARRELHAVRVTISAGSASVLFDLDPQAVTLDVLNAARLSFERAADQSNDDAL
jgi:hypothetical protein